MYALHPYLISRYCREGSGFDSLATQLRASKEDKAFIHLSLEILSQAVRNDGHCKATLADREDILQYLAQLLAYEQVRLSMTQPFLLY